MPVKGIGTAGTANAGVQTIQGIASMTPVQIADNSGSITVDNAGTFAVQAACTNAGTFAVQAAQTGTWTVDLGATDNAVLDAIAASLAGTLTVGSHAVTNAGTFAVQAAQSGTWTVDLGATDNAVLDSIAALLGTIDTDTGGIATSASTIAGAVSGTEMQVDIVAALPAGTNNIGDVGLTPRTSGGCSVFRSIDLDETEEEVKATAGQLYGYYFANLAATVRYIKFYNATAANVTVGSTTPLLTLPVPAGAAGHINLPMAVAFDTAITAAATTGVADNDTGAPAANDVVLNVFYK